MRSANATSFRSIITSSIVGNIGSTLLLLYKLRTLSAADFSAVESPNRGKSKRAPAFFCYYGAETFSRLSSHPCSKRQRKREEKGRRRGRRGCYGNRCRTLCISISHDITLTIAAAKPIRDRQGHARTHWLNEASTMSFFKPHLFAYQRFQFDKLRVFESNQTSLMYSVRSRHSLCPARRQGSSPPLPRSSFITP